MKSSYIREDILKKIYNKILWKKLYHTEKWGGEVRNKK